MVWDPAAARAVAAAARFGARVFARELEGFGAQRRFALAQCRSPGCCGSTPTSGSTRRPWPRWRGWRGPAARRGRLRARAPHLFPRPPHPLLRLAGRDASCGCSGASAPASTTPWCTSGRPWRTPRAAAGRARAPQLCDLGRLRAQARELRARGRREGAAGGPGCRPARRALASAVALRAHVRPAVGVPRRLPWPGVVRARRGAGLPEVRRALGVPPRPDAGASLMRPAGGEGAGVGAGPFRARMTGWTA